MTSGGKRQTAAALYERVKAVEAEMEAMENALKSTRIENEEVRTHALSRRERENTEALLSFPLPSSLLPFFPFSLRSQKNNICHRF